MRTNSTQVGRLYQELTKSIAGLVFLGVVALPLTGCGDTEGGGPLISSLSTPTEDRVSADGAAEPNVDFDATSSSSDETQTTDTTENEIDDSEALANLPDPDEEDTYIQEDPEITVTSTPTEDTVSVRLTWDPSANPDVAGYNVYYGKQSSGEYGSCSYEEGQVVEAPPATINGLEANTPYFFAISAYGGEGGESESPCSNEVLVVTPPTLS